MKFDCELVYIVKIVNGKWFYFINGQTSLNDKVRNSLKLFNRRKCVNNLISSTAQTLLAVSISSTA